MLGQPVCWACASAPPCPPCPTPWLLSAPQVPVLPHLGDILETPCSLTPCTIVFAPMWAWLASESGSGIPSLMPPSRAAVSAPLCLNTCLLKPFAHWVFGHHQGVMTIPLHRTQNLGASTGITGWVSKGSPLGAGMSYHLSLYIQFFGMCTVYN